jgi:hypothetical protein
LGLDRSLVVAVMKRGGRFSSEGAEVPGVENLKEGRLVSPLEWWAAVLGRLVR